MSLDASGPVRDIHHCCLQRTHKDEQALQATMTTSLRPSDLRTFWRDVLGAEGFELPVLAFYGHSEGPHRAFSNFFEHGPFDFELPEACGRASLVASGRTASIRITFSEKAIMLCKAAVMNDLRSFDAITRAVTPAEVKKLGRGVGNWNQAAWDKIVCEVARESVLQKFSKVAGLVSSRTCTGHPTQLHCAAQTVRVRTPS